LFQIESGSHFWAGKRQRTEVPAVESKTKKRGGEKTQGNSVRSEYGKGGENVGDEVGDDSQTRSFVGARRVADKKVKKERKRGKQEGGEEAKVEACETATKRSIPDRKDKKRSGEEEKGGEKL